MKQQRRADLIFIAVIALAHVVFYLLALHYRSIFNGDSFEYIQEAYNIKDHFFFYSGNLSLPIEAEDMTLRTPLYPLFLCCFYLLHLGNYAVLLVQNVISVFNIAYARKLLSLFGYEAKYDWLLLLLVVFFPSQFVYANTIAPDLLLQTFVLIYFRHAVLLLRQYRLKHAAVMSAALIIGLFIKPVLYPFTFIHLFIVLFACAKKRRTVARFFVVALVPLLFVLGYNYANYQRTGKFHFSSIQSFNAIYYYYNFYAAEHGTDAAKQFLAEERTKIAAMPQFIDRYDYANERGMALLQKNLVPYVLFHLKKSAQFFLESGKGEVDLFTKKMTLENLYHEKTESFSTVIKSGDAKGAMRYIATYPSALLALIVVFFNAVKIVGFLAFLFYTRQERQVKIFVALFVAYFALITGPITNAHYVLPVSLIIAGIAVVGFVSFNARKNNSIITR